jgi:hypothetical protein
MFFSYFLELTAIVQLGNEINKLEIEIRDSVDDSMGLKEAVCFLALCSMIQSDF